ncbi:unnamed protein product [Camellia sinensis]
MRENRLEREREMEVVSLRKSCKGGGIKEEKRVESSGNEESFKEEIVLKFGNGRDDHEDHNLKPLSPNRNENQMSVMPTMDRSSAEPNSRASSSVQKDQLESAKAEMGEVREENKRLRMNLNRIIKEYQTLQMQFYDIARQESKESTNTAREETEDPDQLVSLSLGRTSRDSKKDIEKPRKGKEDIQQDDKEGLALGLHCDFDMSKTRPIETPVKPSPENSLEMKEEEAGEGWAPNKVLKTTRSEDDEVSQQNPAKKARVSVRVRCDTPTMVDGCQWRKYGQKIAKGNPCPRAYYRCTVSPSCPVRKQVQRCAEDTSILTTTYEGTHNHPLPISATAMASTTSAAASMLLSGSSTSSGGTITSATAADFRGLNFYLSDHSKSKQFYLPNCSMSSSPSYPTITLDLTTPTPSSSSSSSHFNITSSSNFLSTPRYSSTNLNFSSFESNPIPVGVLNYGSQTYNKNQVNSLSFARQPQENFYHTFMQKGNPNPNPNPPQQPLQTDAIAAATKAITSDPSFQSALAAALTSIIGVGGSGGGGNPGYQIESNKVGQNSKFGEPFPLVSSFPSATPNGIKCSSSYFNRPPSSANSQPGSLMFLQPALPPLSTSEGKSTSPSRDHVL